MAWKKQWGEKETLTPLPIMSVARKNNLRFRRSRGSSAPRDS